MADKSKIRMNLAAIKRVDPYAKDIVDSTAHVAFYTFNSDDNEWEKTDVEGAFFIYSRNAEPFNSIFINNRLNTTSFVEPITGQLELQSQPPFLLYRNDRSRIRGFWFYNSLECDRIGELVSTLIQECDVQLKISEPIKQNNINIFNMLSKAQQEFNNSQSVTNNQEVASRNVLKFFAAAKPSSASEVPFFQRVLPNTLSVEQLEMQQRVKTPLEDNPSAIYTMQKSNLKIENEISKTPSVVNLTSPSQRNSVVETSPLANFFNSSAVLCNTNEVSGEQRDNCLRQLLVNDVPNHDSFTTSKPALMPPTMFEKPVSYKTEVSGHLNIRNKLDIQEPLNQTQLIQAFSYLIKNDTDFIKKLHEAYLKSFADVIS